MKKKILSILLCLFLFVFMLTGCQTNETSPSTENDSSAYEEETEDLYEDEEYEGYGEAPEVDAAAYTGEGSVQTFIGEPFYDGVIKDEYDALDAIYSVLDFVGGDASTELDPVVIQTTEDDTTYYTFRQMAGDVAVYGSTVKLITDKDGQAIGLVSSLVPNLQVESMYDWSIDADEAEAIVEYVFSGEGLKIVPGVTEQTLLPFEDDSSNFYYAWVVYTNNIYDDVDTAYIAHYVDESGNYLYSMPVSQPGSKEALAGGAAAFAFDGMEEANWTGTVTGLLGESYDIDIPVMIDSETGNVILGDKERQILCADYADFEFENTLTPCIAENEEWDPEAILTYANFILVYDLFKSVGWEGPDNDNTPCLLLMNAVDANGDPLENACYGGLVQGFQTFMFDTTAPYGEAMDVMAHEFTHCFTSTTMTMNIYMNDTGAINEGMSDILGNLAAMMLDDTDEPYVIGDKIPDIVRRTMGDPNRDQQPEFVWDRYYLPECAESTDSNDNGGVHTNSSLLNILSYRLHEAGMSPEDEFYYWMNVSFAMTPKTDYTQMLDILPWVMEKIGYPQYVDVMKNALDATGLKDRSLPSVPPEGYGIITLDFPDQEVLDLYEVLCSMYEVKTEDSFATYPEVGTNRISATLPEGDYFVSLSLYRPDTEQKIYVIQQQDSWVLTDEDGFYDSLLEGNQDAVTLHAGEIVTLDNKALQQAIDENTD